MPTSSTYVGLPGRGQQDHHEDGQQEGSGQQDHHEDGDSVLTDFLVILGARRHREMLSMPAFLALILSGV